MPIAEMGDAYLDLMERTLTGTLVEDPPIVTERHRSFMQSMAQLLYGEEARISEGDLATYQPGWRENGLDCPSTAFTMIGLKRLHNFRILISRCIEEGVPGDILETGVWRGGASIMARAVLRAWGEPTRRVFVADSFAGLPPPRYAQDGGSTLHEQPELAVPLDTVRDNFAKFDLLDSRVVFLKGWFRDTMPMAPISQLAVIRLDGDMYESTIDPLNHMYDRLSVGGWVIVDDFFIDSCRAAVNDFLDARGLKPVMTPIDKFSVYFQKGA